MSELPVGSSITDTYVIQSVLFPERTSEGATYVVVKRDTDQTFLCQDVGPSGSSHEDLFQQAVELLKSIHHPNLAEVHETFSVGGREYLVLEAPHAHSLESVAHNHPEAGNRMLREWADQICDAFGALDSKLPCLVLDQADPGQIMGDDSGHFRLVNFHLGRCFTNDGKVVGESDADRAVNYKTCADLLSFLATKRQSKLDLNAVRTFNPKLAAVVQRCQAFLQYPGLSFQEIKRSVWQALPEEAVEKRSKLQMEGLGVLHLLKQVSFRTWLMIATGMAVLSAVYHMFQIRPDVWALKNSAAYAVCNENLVEFVDGDTYRQSHVLSVSAQQPHVTDVKVVADGLKVLVCNAAAHEVDCFTTDTHALSSFLKFSYTPVAILASGVHDRTPWVIGAGRAQEVSVSPAFLMKRGIALGLTYSDSVYAMSPDHGYIFVSIPKYRGIRVIDINNQQILTLAIAAPATPSCMAVSPDGKELWVGSTKTGNVYVLPLEPLINSQNISAVTTGTTITGQSPDFKPVDIEFSGDGSQAAIVSPDTNQVMVVNTAGHKVAGTAVTQGKHPVQCSFGSNVLWVACEDSDSLDVINLATLSPFKTVKMQGSPSVVQFIQLADKGS